MVTANLERPAAAGTLLERVQAELDAQRRHIPDYRKGLDAKWETKTAEEPARFIDRNGRIKADVLANFRRIQLFVPDTPATDYDAFSVRNLLDGARRGEKRMLIECYERLERVGALATLRRYPTPDVGNPYVFNWKGTRFTYRWHKHMHFITLVNRLLRSKLSDDFIGLDLGSSYGIFPSLMKQEFPRSHYVLVDFPEQLLMAYYFLGSYLPGARIAGTRELAEAGTVDADFIRQYDFVLVPVTMYDRLAPGAVELYSNFASLGEMRREWFRGYLESPVFTSSRYFFCANRYESAPTYDSDLTVVDYPVWDPSRRIHFTTSPVFSHIYTRKNLFFNEKLTYPQYFEYIGKVQP